ncbi:hypothetical protein CHELA1G11_20686 [Hyphomicrobiales bacterium]|nr:hypothetical protein CHELA1G11_20686 [Hyphomicrobiales bacterium]CAH1691429.1 hypothetical protein CHELA1G2_21001 [Hyphomicrobiales bacterium]
MIAAMMHAEVADSMHNMKQISAFPTSGQMAFRLRSAHWAADSAPLFSHQQGFKLIRQYLGATARCRWWKWSNFFG